jgi:murein DD-endopeptidase MepM/ murein hydrolase activator NlpD
MSKSNGAWNGGAGNVVMINHSDLGPNVRSIYAHLQRTNVSVGQTVAKGDVIGFLGSTGRSTGPHLHIEFCGTQNPLIANPRLGL